MIVFQGKAGCQKLGYFTPVCTLDSFMETKVQMRTISCFQKRPKDGADSASCNIFEVKRSQRHLPYQNPTRLLFLESIVVDNSAQSSDISTNSTQEFFGTKNVSSKLRLWIFPFTFRVLLPWRTQKNVSLVALLAWKKGCNGKLLCGSEE